MRATEFEFRYRAVIGTSIYFVAMALYALDHRNVVTLFVQKISASSNPKQLLLFHLIYGIGALLVLCAALIRTWAAAYLTSDVVQDPALRANVVVADGPYRHLRNPLYLGGMLFAFGLATLANTEGFLLICIGQTVFFLRMIGLEEYTFKAAHEARYRVYCARVPRLWPSLQPRVPAGNLNPRWLQGFLGEIFMWGFVAAMSAWAITLNKSIAWWALGFAFLLYVVRSCILYANRQRAVAS